MKKNIFLLSFFVILFSFTLKVDASTNLSVEQMEKLKNLGFSEEEIIYLNKQELEDNLKIDGELVSKVTKYYRVVESQGEQLRSSLSKSDISNHSLSVTDASTVQEINEDTYWKEVNEALHKETNPNLNQSNAQNITLANVNPDVSKTSYKSLTTTISTITAKTKYRVKTSVKWDIMPSNRKKDVIGTAINSSFWAPDSGSQNGKQIWTKNYNCNNPKTTHSVDYPSSKSTLWDKGPSGYALTVDLPDDVATSYACTVERVEALTAFSYYNVSRLASTTRIDAYGKLLHQETLFTVSPNVTFYPFSFGVSASQQDKFTSTTTHATFNF